MVVFHWFYKGWGHFGPFSGPVFFKYVGLRNRIGYFEVPSFKNGVFSIGSTTGSAKPFERISVLSDAILGHFGTAGLLFGPDFLQRPSLRPGAGPHIEDFHRNVLLSSGSRSGNSISSERPQQFFCTYKKVSHMHSTMCFFCSWPTYFM